MTALTSPPAPVPTSDSSTPPPAADLSQAITGSPTAGVQTPHTPSQAVRSGRDSLTIGQAAALTGLHKNTIRAYIKQGRIAAGVVRGKYGQEYRLERAEVVAVAALIAPAVDQEPTPVLTAPAPPGPHHSGESGGSSGSAASQGLEAQRDTEVSLGLPSAADQSTVDAEGVTSPPTPSLEPLVGLMRHLQEENRTLAGQLGFVQAQLQQARETIRLLQAPPEAGEGGEDGVIETFGQDRSAEDVGRLTAELEQARRQIAEFEEATEELEREQQAAATSARPWWRFWG